MALAVVDWKTATRKNSVLKIIQNGNLHGSKFLVYVHWSTSMKPFPGEIALLKTFEDKKIEPLIILNFDSGIDIDSTVEEWKSLSQHIICRANKGRDLAGFRTGWEFLSRFNLHEVYYLNNSIAWLPSKMHSFVDQLTNCNEEIFGVTDCELPSKHIQSFGLASKGAGVIELGQNISRLRNARTKIASIIFGEVRLLKTFSRLNKFPPVLYTYQSLLGKSMSQNMTLEEILYQKQPTMQRFQIINEAAKNGVPLNPSHFFWLEMYQLGFPGVKKDLFRKNPSRIPDIHLAPLYLSQLDLDELKLYRFEPELYIKDLILKMRKIINV